jgi:amino acid permease
LWFAANISLSPSVANYTAMKDGSSLFWAVVNFTKLCIGSGVLALPFAAGKGGLFFTPIGLFFIGCWNVRM